MKIHNLTFRLKYHSSVVFSNEIMVHETHLKCVLQHAFRFTVSVMLRGDLQNCSRFRWVLLPFKVGGNGLWQDRLLLLNWLQSLLHSLTRHPRNAEKRKEALLPKVSHFSTSNTNMSLFYSCLWALHFLSGNKVSMEGNILPWCTVHAKQVCVKNNISVSKRFYVPLEIVKGLLIHVWRKKCINSQRK